MSNWRDRREAPVHLYTSGCSCSQPPVLHAASCPTLANTGMRQPASTPTNNPQAALGTTSYSYPHTHRHFFGGSAGFIARPYFRRFPSPVTGHHHPTSGACADYALRRTRPGSAPALQWHWLGPGHVHTYSRGLRRVKTVTAMSGKQPKPVARDTHITTVTARKAG